MKRNVTPCACEFAHADEEPLDLVAIQLRGRLIENDEAGAVREGAGDLHQLARLDLEVAGAHVLRDRDVPLIENVARLAAQRAPADEAAARRLAIDQEVLGDRQVGNDGRMLIDAGDASPPGLPVRERRRRLAGKAHLPLSGSRRPVRIPTRVDLPAPLRPTSACDSPGMTRICASLSATVAP